MLHPGIRGRIWAHSVPTQYARFDAVELRSRCYTRKPHVYAKGEQVKHTSMCLPLMDMYV